MSNIKRISKNNKFIIYGGGEVGNKCCQSLIEQGYHVAFALDKNKSGKHIIDGINTYKLGTEPEEMDKSCYIIIICLANGMIHKDVADELYSRGYLYIVFLPLNYCIPDEQKRNLTRLYNHVLWAEPEMKEYSVLDYCQYIFPDMSVENSVIRKTTQYLTVWMREEILFSESLELWEGDKSKIHIRDEYEDRNILCAHPYEDLFNFYALKSESGNLYFDSKKERLSQAEEVKEINQREELYRVFRREHNIGMDFFVEGAPQVIWNPNAYFNLVGGHHRTVYLLHEGHSLFPVKMQYDDFNKWFNEEVYKELKEYIYKHHIKRFYAPFPHPCFINFPVKWEDVGRTKLSDAMRFFSNIDVSDMMVLDCSDDEGYFARNLDRIGARETFFLNCSDSQIELADLFNRLLYRNNIILKKGRLEDIWGEVENNRKYDIVFALDRTDIENVHLKSQVELLGLLCNQYLFMETTRSEEIEYIQKCTGFKTYTCIHREYRYGRIWELGIYSR